jgi:hypothetical protein
VHTRTNIEKCNSYFLHLKKVEVLCNLIITDDYISSKSLLRMIYFIRASQEILPNMKVRFDFLNNWC